MIMTQRAFGMENLDASVRSEWLLDPDFLTVNHGSFGATPRRVLAAQDEWRRRMEAQPTRFMVRDLPGLLRRTANELAAFVGAAGEDLVFVENATTGCNAVLRSLTLGPGDEVVVLSHGYGAVVKTVRYVTALAGARVVEAELAFPRPGADEIVAALSSVLGSRTRLAVLDHITSHSALLLPIARMVAACSAAGVPVLVDGAHGPGQVPLDLPSIGADWYVGNCHKWLMAPKGAGFLWAAPGRQVDLHPGTISHGYGQGYLAEFDWTGTKDPSAYLAVSEALAFHRELGGAALMRRNAALAAEATAMLAERLGTETGSNPAMMSAMGLVRLPLDGHVTEPRALAIRAHLLDAGTDAPVNAIDGGAWLRLSVQAYNDLDDFRRLATIVRETLASL